MKTIDFLLKEIENRELRITVLGMGYIGLPTAIILAKAGFVVQGFDTNKNVINILKKGHIHIVEPDLQETFKIVLEKKKFIPVDNLEKSDVFIIAVPTPFKKSSEDKIADLSYVENAIKDISNVLEKNNLIILESTVPPMTTDLMTRTLERKSEISSEYFMIAHCPERVLPGKILYELENNDRIIGTKDKKTGEFVKKIYETFVKNGVCYITDTVTAEMCKLVENTFRDINIAFANELSIICDKMEIDVFNLIKLANKHPRVNILKPGAGVGGHCLAVDPWFIVEKFPEETNIIKQARLMNDFKPEYISDKVDRILKNNKSKTIGILGLAYKPDIDDLRESPAIKIAKILMCKGYTVIGCEPNTEKKEIEGIFLYSFDEILEKADYYILAQAHKKFKEELYKIKDKRVYDCLGILE